MGMNTTNTAAAQKHNAAVEAHKAAEAASAEALRALRPLAEKARRYGASLPKRDAAKLAEMRENHSRLGRLEIEALDAMRATNEALRG